MKKHLLALIILVGTIGFHLWLNFPETQILADPNDNIFQYSLIYRTNWIWEQFHCPLSLSCIPNLIDHLVPTWAEGYPLPYYYSHIPQIATVGSYHLIIDPASHALGHPLTLFQYYNWIKYLLMCLFPLSVFAALWIVGFSPILCAIGAFFSTHYSTDGLYGIDITSFLWRGYGLTSQLYGMTWFPIGLALIYKTMRTLTDEENGKPRTHDLTVGLGTSTIATNTDLRSNRGIGVRGKERSLIAHLNHIIKIPTVLLAGLAMIATTAGHLGMGIQGLLISVPLVLIDLKIYRLKKRVITLGVIGTIVIVGLAYWVIPAALGDNYHMNSFWDPIWKFDSYGWMEVVKQYLTGAIFDFGRPPVLTALITIGFFAALLSKKWYPFAFSFVFSILLYFGRTTWGGLIDLIPGMNGYHLHRFIVAVEMSSLFLIPAALEGLFSLCVTQTKRILTFIIKHDDLKRVGINPSWLTSPKTPIIVTVLLLSAGLIAGGFACVKRTYDYAILNNKWINEANVAYQYDEHNYKDLVSYLQTLPPARIYAGRPGNWGKDFRLGSTQMYMLLGIHGFDMSQFLPETWSPLSENEQNFDERVAEDYDLLNIRHVLASKNENFSSAVTQDRTFGPFVVFNAPSTGWFDIVTAPMFVKSTKSNFLNIVHLWHRSFPRRWKMHPFISFEKNPQIPIGMNRQYTMLDEANFSEAGVEKNIFEDFPFTFPTATPSGTIQNEAVNQQMYRATVEVPDPCPSCVIMFKMSYHPNWKVWVDGTKAQTYAVFPMYLATPLTPGTHTVEFRYEPSSFKLLLLSGEIILLAGVGGYLLYRKLHRSKSLH